MEHFRFEGSRIEEIVVYFGFDFRVDPFADVKVKRLSKAFATGEVDYIAGNIAKDVQWHFVGEAELQGREAVTNMLEPMRGVVAEEYRTKNIITAGNKAVVEGTMIMPEENGQEKLYSFCDIYTFDHTDSNIIKELSAYLIELPSKEEANKQ
ncbi:nuclear transport factor 2 family protein [Radiobacillus kanasensis]|uniref:nuclear transport factor 2 family protein n=1 Tax=Radiobacillus kanasensis TaxID=2844358 RepID=UPI002EDBABE1